MTLAGAIESATSKAKRSGERWAVICRTDHPYVQGDYFYAIAWAEKRLWTPGEYLLALV